MAHIQKGDFSSEQWRLTGHQSEGTLAADRAKRDAGVEIVDLGAVGRRGIKEPTLTGSLEHQSVDPRNTVVVTQDAGSTAAAVAAEADATLEVLGADLNLRAHMDFVEPDHLGQHRLLRGDGFVGSDDDRKAAALRDRGCLEPVDRRLVRPDVQVPGMGMLGMQGQLFWFDACLPTALQCRRVGKGLSGSSLEGDEVSTGDAETKGRRACQMGGQASVRQPQAHSCSQVEDFGQRGRVVVFRRPQEDQCMAQGSSGYRSQVATAVTSGNQSHWCGDSGWMGDNAEGRCLFISSPTCQDCRCSMVGSCVAEILSFLEKVGSDLIAKRRLKTNPNLVDRCLLVGEIVVHDD